jgi:inosine/guanosine/xanthosine phosphorylase family protein
MLECNTEIVHESRTVRESVSRPRVDLGYPPSAFERSRDKVNLSILEEAVRRVRREWPEAAPASVLVLGSGWGELAASFGAGQALSYEDIPGLGAAQVAGHVGQLHLASAAERELLVFQGRRHWYEGLGWEPVALPVLLAVRFGAARLVLTNAAGSIHPDLNPGDLMIIDDHINAMGANPLIGPHASIWGPRFPDQTAVYDTRLRAGLDAAADRAGITVSHGVYLAASGPAYETPAEIEAYRRMGADAVGMSTVPEAMLGHAAGLRVAAVSCISNKAAGITGKRLSHDEVLAATQAALPRMQSLLHEFLKGPDEPQAVKP